MAINNEKAEPIKARLSYRPSDLPPILGIGRVSIFEAIKDGRLKARKFGAATIILHEDVVAFLANLPPAGKAV